MPGSGPATAPLHDVADPVFRVALPLPLPRLFDYRAPEGRPADGASVGCRIRVPFGSRELIGVVAGVGPVAADAPELRTALALLDPVPLLQGELLESLRWLARYTHAPLGDVFATALPTALRRGDPLPTTHAWAWRLTEAGLTARPSRPTRLINSAPRSRSAPRGGGSRTR